MDDVNEQVEYCANLAVEMSEAMSFGVLDFSEASVETLERMADEVADYFDDMTPEQREKSAQYFGCYILEVARRNHGGQYYWHEERDQPVLVVGEPNYRIAILTWDKAQGRLSGDPAESLTFFYRGFSKKVREAQPGDDVLFV